MSTYEAGFALGERQAWEDRKAGKPPEALGQPRTQLQRGYADGYMPRCDADRPVWWAPGQIKPLDTVQELERTA